MTLALYAAAMVYVRKSSYLGQIDCLMLWGDFVAEALGVVGG